MHTPNIPPQSRLLAEAIYPKADTNIKVMIGGPKKVGWKYAPGGRGGTKTNKKGYKFKFSGGSPAGLILFGAEFGSDPRTKGRHYVMRYNPDGYWLKHAGEEQANKVMEEWRRIAARYCEKVSSHG